MPKNSREKGKRGELELCHKLAELFGWKAERAQQYNGNAGDSDVLVKEHPGLFLECKRVQSLSIHKTINLAVEQSAKKGLLPAVFHRRNGEEWLVSIRLQDLLRLSAMLGPECRSITEALPPCTASSPSLD